MRNYLWLGVVWLGVGGLGFLSGTEVALGESGGPGDTVASAQNVKSVKTTSASGQKAPEGMADALDGDFGSKFVPQIRLATELEADRVKREAEETRAGASGLPVKPTGSTVAGATGANAADDADRSSRAVYGSQALEQGEVLRDGNRVNVPMELMDAALDDPTATGGQSVGQWDATGPRPGPQRVVHGNDNNEAEGWEPQRARRFFRR